MPMEAGVRALTNHLTIRALFRARPAPARDRKLADLLRVERLAGAEQVAEPAGRALELLREVLASQESVRGAFKRGSFEQDALEVVRDLANALAGYEELRLRAGMGAAGKVEP